METVIEIQHLKKHFGSLEVLNDINFSVQKGEVVTVIGSSGSGKSTMLRCINMLETPSGGSILSWERHFRQRRRCQSVPFPGRDGVPELQPLQQ